MPVATQASALPKGPLRRLAHVFQIMVFLALFYSVAAFMIGWVVGDLDYIDGAGVLSTRCSYFGLSSAASGAVQYVQFAGMIAVLYAFTPRDGAWLTRFCQKRGGLVGIGVLVLLFTISVAVLSSFFVLSGCPILAGDISIIASAGVLAGGFLQVMSAAVQPNPASRREQELLRQQQDKARQSAVEKGLDPDEAAAVTETIWNDVGSRIGKITITVIIFMDTVIRLIDALVGMISSTGGDGLHGRALFLLVASFLIGLVASSFIDFGFGVSGPAFLVLYAIPLLIALADTATLYAFPWIFRLAGGHRRVVWAAVLAPAVAVFGMVLKAAFIVGGAAILTYFGGPEIPWRIYADAAMADPFGRGLTVTILLASSLVWPLLLLVEPIGREFRGQGMLLHVVAA